MKVKVLKRFKDKHNLTRIYKAGEVIDITEERFNEIIAVDAFVEKIEATEEVAEEKPKKKPAKKKKAD